MKNIDTPMDVEVKLIHPEEKEYVEIGCHKVDERIDEITRFIRSRQGNLEGYTEGDMYNVPIADVYYIESVDDRTFLYLEKETYESALKLYEFEQQLSEKDFIRISKQSILNLRKVKSLRSDINRKIRVTLQNDEQIIVSRMYSDELRKRLGVK